MRQLHPIPTSPHCISHPFMTSPSPLAQLAWHFNTAQVPGPKHFVQLAWGDVPKRWEVIGHGAHDCWSYRSYPNPSCQNFHCWQQSHTSHQKTSFIHVFHGKSYGELMKNPWVSALRCSLWPSLSPHACGSWAQPASQPFKAVPSASKRFSKHCTLSHSEELLQSLTKKSWCIQVFFGECVHVFFAPYIIMYSNSMYYVYIEFHHIIL